MTEALTDRTANQYATFLVGRHYLGIAVREVQEVLREQHLTPIPLAAEVVAGLINLRGQIVPELEMRRLLRLPPRDADTQAFSVVVRSEHGPVSLQVDQIDNVHILEPESLELPPQSMDPQLRRLVRGVHKLKDRLLLILDTARTVELGADQH